MSDTAKFTGTTQISLLEQYFAHLEGEVSNESKAIILGVELASRFGEVLQKFILEQEKSRTNSVEDISFAVEFASAFMPGLLIAGLPEKKKKEKWLERHIEQLTCFEYSFLSFLKSTLNERFGGKHE